MCGCIGLHVGILRDPAVSSASLHDGGHPPRLEGSLQENSLLQKVQSSVTQSGNKVSSIFIHPIQYIYILYM